MSDQPKADIPSAGNNYDASYDPRTGRPPTPLEAQKMAREHQAEHTKDQSAEERIEYTQNSPMIEGQQPACMASPTADRSEEEAVEALLQEGVTRERAEELVSEHGTNWETLKAAAFAQDDGNL
ncbi:hypothetical protein [Taklimakanibacter albus]|uniref:Uncharacterized protein n=1 Tax=Taklimakanibacter albus TaxID=2800327 RepID=A0ACC5R2Y4_9HYPH|nr:hypothetical protein [Aestuariivirga sp. YIM B02566]MBK1866995.1 hypothetical protein [Aestuariivirga sp. YIM B02566]